LNSTSLSSRGNFCDWGVSFLEILNTKFLSTFLNNLTIFLNLIFFSVRSFKQKWQIPKLCLQFLYMFLVLVSYPEDYPSLAFLAPELFFF